MIGRLIICCLLFSLNVAAQEQDSVGNGRSRRSIDILKNRLRQVQQYLDSADRAKVDMRYIEVPEKPWRIILRHNENQVEVDYSQSVDFPGTNEYSDWKLCFQPPRASSIGLWVGYRGTGVGFSVPLNKNAGRYFYVSSTGAKYGFNFRLRRFNTREVPFTATSYKDGQFDSEMEESGYLPSPVWIRSVYLNGYYVFNGRHYSQAAAYNQSVIQRRSAGSLLIGATWNQSSFDYSDIDNGLFMIVGHGIHRIKVHQANIGVGYGYNFVPFRGFVINAMIMPTISVYNRVKVYKYDFNFDVSNSEGQVDDYGQWNPETRTWANGKTHKPLLMAKWPADKVDYWDLEPETDYSSFRLNGDLRLGLAYNWRNYFMGLQMQFNNITYKKDQCKVSLIDAYAQLSLGIRL